MLHFCTHPLGILVVHFWLPDSRHASQVDCKAKNSLPKEVVGADATIVEAPQAIYILNARANSKRWWESKCDLVTVRIAFI